MQQLWKWFGGGVIGLHSLSMLAVAQPIAPREQHQPLMHWAETRRANRRANPLWLSASAPTSTDLSGINRPLPQALPTVPPRSPLQLVQAQRDTTAVAFSADGQWVVGVSQAQEVTVWAVETGTEVQQFQLPNQPIVTLNVMTRSTTASPEAEAETGEQIPYVITSSHSGQVSMWDPATGAAIQQFAAHDASVGAVAIAPPAQQIATSSDRAVKLWQWNDELGEVTLQRTLTGHRDRITALAMTPDGAFVISASWDEIRIWSAATGRLVQQLRGDFGRVNALAVDSTQPQLLSGSNDGQIRVWDLPTITPDSANADADNASMPRAESGADDTPDTPDPSDLTSPESAAAPDRSSTASAAPELVTTPRRAWPAHANGVSTLALDGAQGIVVSSGADNQIRTWAIASGAPQSPPLAQAVIIETIALSPNGTLAIGAQGHHVSLWNLPTGQVQKQLTRSQLPPIPAQYLPFPGDN